MELSVTILMGHVAAPQVGKVLCALTSVQMARSDWIVRETVHVRMEGRVIRHMVTASVPRAGEGPSVMKVSLIY